MLRMLPYTLMGVVAAGLLQSPVASAQFTKDEFKCELGTDKLLDKFTQAKVKCILKCEDTARKGDVPFSNCEPPYAGLAAACISGAEKGAEAKAVAAIVKACSKDCPECYGDCSATGYPSTRVLNTEAKIDLLVPQVACEHTADKAKAKCINSTAKTLVKFVQSKDKCYEKCLTTAYKGSLSSLPCMPPATQPDTVACIAKVEGKATAAINNACFVPPANAPTCYDGSPLRPNTGAGWVVLAEASVDAGVPAIFCGSPGGAFVE